MSGVDATRTIADEQAPRFYGELAVWWPLISLPSDYAEEAAYAGRLLGSAAIPVTDVLELGTGGGNNAVHLKKRFRMTLTDISAEMLAVSRALNPDCEHVQGDMRTLRLGREFDAVFIHDAVDYMTSLDDLRRAIETARAHCRRGGVLVIIPDTIREAFEESSEVSGNDGADGRAVRFMEWSWDPNPDDTWTQTEYSFLLRDPDGRVRAVHESHRLGLFSRVQWLDVMRDAGFDATVIVEETSEERRPREVFVGRLSEG